MHGEYHGGCVNRAQYIVCTRALADVACVRLCVVRLSLTEAQSEAAVGRLAFDVRIVLLVLHTAGELVCNLISPRNNNNIQITVYTIIVKGN